MSASVATLQSMGQDDSYQARCKPCDWAGDVLDSRAEAMRQGLTHDADAHQSLDGSGPEGSMPIVDVDAVLAQLQANAPKLAPLYAAHMDACVAAGFSREESLILTSDWARLTLWGGQL